MNSTLVKRSSLIKAVSSILVDICKENTKDHDTNNNSIEPFLSKRNSISIKSFIEYLVKDTQIESSVIVTMLILIDRLCAKNNFQLNYFNIQRIILSTLILASKVNLDDNSQFGLYNKVKGINSKEIFLIEYQCCTLLDFSLYISEQDFTSYYDYLIKVIRMNAQ